MDLQEFTQNAVAAEVEKLAQYDVGNGATIVTRPKTGEILAMVGSKDYFAQDEDGKVNVTLAKRQPGSAIKPLNYALALKDKKITAATPLADVPTCFSVVGQPIYCPRNYDGAFHGLVQARFALGNSYNLPAVKVLALNGVENFVEFAKSMGISTFTDPSNYGLSLTLGGGEVTPYDMAVAFGVFANQGIKVPLISIVKVEDWKGKILEEINVDEIEGDRVLTPDVTFIISHILHDNNARAGAFGASSFLNVRGHPEVSVKTGTTNDRRDNWTIGFTAHALTATWVGNNDNSPMSPYLESGNTGAAPIWHILMQQAIKDLPAPFPTKPDNIVFLEVCSLSGLLPNNDCPKRGEYFIKSFVPKDPDTVWGQKQKVLVYKDTHKVPSPNDHPTPDQLSEEDHLVISDPFQKNYCADCVL